MQEHLNNAITKLAEEFFTPPLSKYTMESAREAFLKALKQLCKSDELAKTSIKDMIEIMKKEVIHESSSAPEVS